MLSVTSKLVKNSCKILALHSTGIFSGAFKLLLLTLPLLRWMHKTVSVNKSLWLGFTLPNCSHLKAEACPKLVIQAPSMTESNGQAVSEVESLHSRSDV